MHWSLILQNSEGTLSRITSEKSKEYQLLSYKSLDGARLTSQTFHPQTISLNIFSLVCKNSMHSMHPHIPQLRPLIGPVIHRHRFDAPGFPLPSAARRVVETAAGLALSAQKRSRFSRSAFPVSRQALEKMGWSGDWIDLPF